MKQLLTKHAFPDLSKSETAENIPVPKLTVGYRASAPVNGYGACKLCDCNGYISRNDGSHVCKKCKHHKSQHHS